MEAARINRDLYEAEHERRSDGVIMVHVKGHSGDIGNDYADTFVQDGKGSGPFSRIRLARSETQAEKCVLIMLDYSEEPESAKTCYYADKLC